MLFLNKDIMEEIWREVHWCSDYIINNHWVVIALPKYFRKKSRTLIPETDKDGYLKTRLVKDWKRKTFFNHHLVLHAFIWDRPKGYVCNHKNGIRDDNRSENLEWVTISYNQQHKFRVLRYNHHSKKVIVQYNKNMKFIQEWPSVVSATKIFWLSRTWISNCLIWRSKTSWGFIWKYKIND